jgi:tetratricopeptide (TPR) repeat protein
LAGVEGWSALSLDPGASREKVLVGLAIAASYFVGRATAARYGRRAVLWASMGSAVAVVVVALAHEVVAAERVFGWHEPKFANPALLGPILNPNHFGGFSAFGSTLCWGLALDQKHAPRRVALAVTGSVCAAVAVAALSRGAILSLFVGTGWVLLLLVIKRRASRARGRWLAVGGVATLVASLIAYAGLEGISHEFRSGDFSKLDLIRKSSELALVQPWFGIGRGAFEPLFARIGVGDVRFTHPESLPIQWLVEWGAPVACGLVVLTLPPLVRALRSSQVAVTGAAGALSALCLHDLFDFSLELPGVASVAAMTFGAVVTSHREKGVRVPRRLAWAALAVASVSTLALAPTVINGRTDAMADAILQSESSNRAVLLADAIRLHPLDPRVALMAGYALRRDDPGKSLRWLNRAMELAPSWSSPHVAAAWVLWSRGANDQALIELRAAESRRLGTGGELLCAVTRRMDAQQIWRHLEGDSSTLRASLGGRIAPCLASEEGLTLDRLLIEREGPLPSPTTRVAEAAWRAGRSDEALELLDRLLEVDDDAVSARLLRARVVRDTSGARAALDSLPTGPATWAEHSFRAQLAGETGDEARLQRELSRLRALAAGDPPRLATAWSMAGKIEESRGNLGAATQAFERAARLDARALVHLQNVARVAERAGQGVRASAARRELCRRGDQASCPRPESP